MSNLYDSLSEKQREVAELYTENEIDRRRNKEIKRLTQEELGEAVGVTGRTIRNWFKDPAFLAYLEHISRLNIQAAMPSFAAVLIQNLEHGQNLSTKQLDLIAKVADWVPQAQSQVTHSVVQIGTEDLQRRLDSLEGRIPKTVQSVDRDAQTVQGLDKAAKTIEHEEDSDGK